MHEIDDLSEPVFPILVQDKCLDENGIDFVRWMRTSSSQITILSEGKLLYLPDESAIMEHLQAIERTTLNLGVVRIETQIVSQVNLPDGPSVIGAIRRRHDRSGSVIGACSINWIVDRTDSHWKISQILFDDFSYDPSVVSQTFLRKVEKATALDRLVDQIG